MKKIIALGIAVLVLVLLWSGAWLFISNRIGAEVTALAQRDGRTEPKIVCETLKVSGFPFRFDTTCANASVTRNDVTLTIAEIKATVLAYAPTHAIVFAKAPARFTDAFTGSTYEVNWSLAEASARLDWTRLKRVSVHVENPVARGSLSDVELMGADLLELHLIDNPEKGDAARNLQTLDIYHRITGYRFPGLEVTGTELLLEGALSGLDADLRVWADEPQPLKRWQANGGKLEITRFDGTTGDMSLKATGEFALTDKGRVNGALDMASTGVVERFSEMLDPMFLALLKTDPNDPKTYRNTIALRSGVIMLGPLPLGIVPALF